MTRISQTIGALFQRIPSDLILFLARFAIAATFWKSGQTKVAGFAVDLIEGRFEPGWPRLSDSAVELFRTEYKLPILPPELAAPLAAAAEHVFPVLLLLGLMTRLSAAALLGMTAVIQLFVYPDAYATHGVWAVCLLALMKWGAGRASLDRLLGVA
jgi:putative oxidoreductase